MHQHKPAAFAYPGPSVGIILSVPCTVLGVCAVFPGPVAAIAAASVPQEMLMVLPHTVLQACTVKCMVQL